MKRAKNQDYAVCSAKQLIQQYNQSFSILLEHTKQLLHTIIGKVYRILRLGLTFINICALLQDTSYIFSPIKHFRGTALKVLTT